MRVECENEYLDSNTVYEQVRTAKVSQNCEGAAQDYFKMVIPLCLHPLHHSIVHSLLRMAVRPFFYLGICDFSSVKSYIEKLNSTCPKFLKWLDENNEILHSCIKELTACCYFYDLKYDKDRNIVVLDHSIDPNMSGIFIEMPNVDIYEEFSTFDQFKAFFSSVISECNLTDDELDRLIMEEGYHEHFDTLSSRPAAPL